MSSNKSVKANPNYWQTINTTGTGINTTGTGGSYTLKFTDTPSIPVKELHVHVDNSFALCDEVTYDGGWKRTEFRLNVTKVRKMWNSHAALYEYVTSVASEEFVVPNGEMAFVIEYEDGTKGLVVDKQGDIKALFLD